MAMLPSFLIDKKYTDYLGQEEIDQLSSIMKFRKVAKNEVLIHAGKAVKEVYYVYNGIARQFVTDENGREINTNFAWDGMLITPYESLINKEKSAESVVTITACELFYFSYDSFKALYDNFPKIERLGRVLAEEAFTCMAERGRLLQTMNAKERYLHFMNTAPTEIFQNIPMQDIASYLGIAAGSLSRIRSEILHIC